MGTIFFYLIEILITMGWIINLLHIGFLFFFLLDPDHLEIYECKDTKISLRQGKDKKNIQKKNKQITVEKMIYVGHGYQI